MTTTTTDIKSFSQALQALEAHGVTLESLGVDEKSKRLVYRVGATEYDKAGVIALAREVDARGPAPAPPVLIGVAMMDQAEARETVEQIKRHFDSARRLLLDLEEREGWRALGYSSWRECAAAEFGQSQAYLYRQLAAAKIEQAIDSPIGEIPESHLREVAKLPTSDQQRAALDRATTMAGDQPRTAQHVKQAAAELAQPFWQSLSANHPTAHLWTQERPDLWRSACGMVTQNRAPDGLLDGGHCSSCVRATWKPNISEQAPEPPPDFADVQARLAARGVTLTSDVRDNKRWYTTSRPGKVGITTPTWSNVVDSLVYQEQRDAPVATWICEVCGAPQTGMREPKPPHCTSCAMKRLSHVADTDRAAYAAKEAADKDTLDMAELEIASGNVNYARQLLGRVQVSTYRRDQLLARLPGIALPIELQKRLVAAGAAIGSDGMVMAPQRAHEAPAVLSEAECEAAIARWSALPVETAPAPSSGVDWNAVARESYRLGATNSTAEAWIAVGNIIKLLDASDPVSAIIWLLAEADLLAPDDLTVLAEDLDDAEYEALAAYRRDRSVPTLESEGIV